MPGHCIHDIVLFYNYTTPVLWLHSLWEQDLSRLLLLSPLLKMVITQYEANIKLDTVHDVIIVATNYSLVPTGSPLISVSMAPSPTTIDLAWEPPLISERNGIITGQRPDT